MITKITSIDELVQIFSEQFYNHQDKITKIGDTTVINGIAYGIAKLGQKTLKEVALVESHILPENAFGSHLDDIARMNGIAPRFPASGSSTFVRLAAQPGTTYQAAINTFKGKEGIIFQLDNDITVGSAGYTYAKVRSLTTGEKSNIKALSIDQVTNEPTGHQFVTNEFQGEGGRDEESDELFRRRVQEGPNRLAKSTLSAMEQVFMSINPNVYSLVFQGIDGSGKVVLAVIAQNGINFTEAEFDEMIQKGASFLALTDTKPNVLAGFNIRLVNIQIQPVDISFRCELLPSFAASDVRKEAQQRVGRYFDPLRYTNPRDTSTLIEWDNLLEIIKSVPGMKYLYDNYFVPRADIRLNKNKVPRVRGFLMLDKNGNPLSDGTENLNPVYYPAVADFSYQATVLQSL